jgi:FERM/RhoGEF/pleckstrin domain protein 2
MLAPEDIENLQPLFDYFESMVQHHSIFLRDLEHRIVMWESRGDDVRTRIGDVMLKNMVVLPIYEEYVEFHREILQRLNDLFNSDERFQQTYKDFEQEKVRNKKFIFLHKIIHLFIFSKIRFVIFRYRHFC